MGRVRHIGLIPDGGRRWSRREEVSLENAYRLALNKVGDFLGWFYERGGDSASLYLLSRANLGRCQDELLAFATAASEFLDQTVPSLMNKFGITPKIAGLPSLGPELLARASMRLEENCFAGIRKLFLCIVYDPFDELLAARRGHQLGVSSDLLASLWVTERIDLVVRTGGAVTLSNFLPLQTAYARLVFVEALFNDVTLQELIRIIEEHERLKLEYGT